MLYLKTGGPSHSVAKSASPVINDIKARLQFTCENVAKAWGRLLTETSLEKCFVEPEIVEEEIGEDGKRRKKETGKTINSYQQLFESDTFGARIVIEGDPGMGKTTYVNKLALDWTWDEGTSQYSDGSPFLQSRFHVVFLIPLRTINGGKSSTLAQAAEIQLSGCGSWLRNKFRNCSADCLLILDAFDEYDGSCREINEIIAGSLFPQLKVIITSRPSHIGSLEKGPQWLSITGFTTKEKRKQFLVKQGWDKLEERDMIEHVLSGLGTFWNTPLYLAMLCVLCKARKVTNFEPRHPNCFHVLVKLFTEHIMSRCVNEKGLKLNGEERQKIKSYIQQRAFQQFSENNPWLTEAPKGNILNRYKSAVRYLFGQIDSTYPASSQSVDTHNLEKQAGQIGLIIVQQELCPITGENVENVSFIHQMFVEYYAAIEFGPIFNNCTNRDQLVPNIDKYLSLTASPFSYFLAAECMSYKQILIRRQVGCCENEVRWYHIDISEFSWLPEIQISDDIVKGILHANKMLYFRCRLDGVKSFWDIRYVNEICSIAQPTQLAFWFAFISYNDEVLNNILSSVNQLELGYCKISWPTDKVYPNITQLKYLSSQESDKLEFLKHFQNLRNLELDVPITDHNIAPLCDSLQNMNQLREMKLSLCFTSSQSVSPVIQLAKTIERSSLCRTLKELNFSRNVFDNERESSTELLFNAISKCVQLEKLTLYKCQMKPECLSSLLDILKNSDNLKSNLKFLLLMPINRYEYFELEESVHIENYVITEDQLTQWSREVKVVLPHCDIPVYYL